jgi:hypothetical protein
VDGATGWPAFLVSGAFSGNEVSFGIADADPIAARQFGQIEASAEISKPQLVQDIWARVPLCERHSQAAAIVPSVRRFHKSRLQLYSSTLPERRLQGSPNGEA